MFRYDRVDISEGIDFNKINSSKGSKICHYCYFKDIGFKHETHLCYGCHGLKQKLLVLMMLLLFMLKGVLTEFNFGI